ncbi:uracil-DNA glycosylase [Paraburkholderia sp. JPY303]|uniref:uracil-DNA glycosylase n=1 Tax=Paraburkholderia atlantica TaxID=2654982 RepID=UPI0015902E4D|nr:uracil-DNA glycosylase [Paraburkholderia atlantica]NUY31950.1 uracil-DNA glycosylase [Paraburkholderia atlantica]
MALHESVLEEFGLAPLWVRRGLAARQAEAGQGNASQTLRADADADADDERRAEPAPQTTREPLRASADVQPPQAPHESAPRLDETATRRETQPQPDFSAPPTFDAPPDDDFAWFDDPTASTPAPAEARRDAPALPAVHTLDWDALAERVSGCEACRLCEKRTNTVFGVGDREADWMLIGEAPGENEDRQGEPFVGPAGKLLDNMLHSLALARGTNVYIANVIKCRPPGNRNPQPDEVARCEPYLQRQVSLVKPKLIVALGRFAAQSLLKTDASISSLRGRVHTYEGVPVIVTYHPAYLLRSLPDKAKAWTDLCLARATWLANGGAPSNESK